MGTFSGYLLAAPLTKMVATLSYWALRKYEDTGREQNSGQYQQALEEYSHSENAKKLAIASAWAKSMWIIAEYKGKIDRLDEIKAELEKALHEIENVGEKDAVPADAHNKIKFLVDRFKQILYETGEEIGRASEKAAKFVSDAETNINRFTEKYASAYLYTAFNDAEKIVLEASKGKLQETQESRAFTINSF